MAIKIETRTSYVMMAECCGCGAHRDLPEVDVLDIPPAISEWQLAERVAENLGWISLLRNGSHLCADCVARVRVPCLRQHAT